MKKQEKYTSDWWEDLDEELQQAIEKSVAEAGEGILIPHEDVMKEYNKWLKTTSEPK